MKSAFRQSFVRDLKKIKDKKIAERIRETIENVDAADDLGAIRNLKKISGTDAYLLPDSNWRVSNRPCAEQRYH